MRRSCRCRLAIAPSSAPAAARGATRRARTSSSQAMWWCLAAKSGLPFTASTAFFPARPMSWLRADASNLTLRRVTKPS